MSTLASGASARRSLLWVLAGVVCVLAAACSRSSGGSRPEPPTTGQLIAEHMQTGERVAAFGPLGSDGSLAAVTEIVYQDAAGNAIAVWLGADGLPSVLAIPGVVVRYINWTSDAVDLYYFTAEDDLAGFALDTPVDPAEIAALRSLATGGSVSAPALASTGSSGGPPLLPAQTTSSSPGNVVRALGLGLKIASCAIAIGAAPATLGATLLVAAIPCSSALISGAALLTGSETLLGIDLALGTASCIAFGGLSPECAALALDVALEQAAQILDERAEQTATIAGNPSLSPEDLGTELVVQHTPISPQARKDAIITATVLPRELGVQLTLHLSGSDGFTMNQSRVTGEGGQSVWVVPGGGEGVTDHYNVTSPDGRLASSDFTYR